MCRRPKATDNGPFSIIEDLSRYQNGGGGGDKKCMYFIKDTFFNSCIQRCL